MSPQVRAVSSEDHEIDKYAETMQKALRKGVRDATIGALTASFNNYLDLGAGVLLLWYGGSIAMSPEGAGVLTVGSLIKYQLYWNMINNAYQSLNNVLNQFTRAAGAAERVLSLLDMEPDIDPTAGLPVERAVRRWDRWYQMRSTLPDGIAPSARLAARTHPGAPPEPLGGSPWPQEPASGRPKVEEAPLLDHQARRSRLQESEAPHRLLRVAGRLDPRAESQARGQGGGRRRARGGGRRRRRQQAAARGAAGARVCARL